MNTQNRKQQSYNIRVAAAQMAHDRPQPKHFSNGDEQRYRRVVVRDKKEKNVPSFIANFTKCLPHDIDGFLISGKDYEDFIRAIDSGDSKDFEAMRIGPGPFKCNGDFEYDRIDGVCLPKLTWQDKYAADKVPKLRAFESQGAGLTYDLEGPDSHSVTMPPAPSLDSEELIAEVAEVYWMALLRDVSFADWGKPAGAAVKDAQDSLAKFLWFREDGTGMLLGASDRLASSLRRRRIFSPDGTTPVPLQKLFRGTSPGDDVGPYVSQFLLIGNKGVNSQDNAHPISKGLIANGSLQTLQKVREAKPKQDYMQKWEEWLDVQNGADLKGREEYVAQNYRFIAAPRDLATYVHYDELYEAYLNACIILLGLGAPFDPGLPFTLEDFIDKQTGFSQFGGPHILTLVTEVATRALKAVRYQKFNIHRRLRPEAVGGWLYQLRQGKLDGPKKDALAMLEKMETAFAVPGGLGEKVAAFNAKANKVSDNWLLPMAFPEGSPAHPSYGAGHAAVAGACVTLLKAWFDHGWELQEDVDNPALKKKVPKGQSAPPGKILKRIVYAANATGTDLDDVSGQYPEPLTVEGELNKLAANIAIARDWAGVHYYTDYYESLRLGEQVALQLLEEQKLTYGENFSMTVPLFDGGSVRI